MLDMRHLVRLAIAGVIGVVLGLVVAARNALGPSAACAAPCRRTRPGDDHITYGVLEADDVHRWGDWLTANRPVERLYGLGVSMGAGILLQFIARDRLHQASGIPRPLLAPVVNIGFLYARLRYDVDLRRSSPVEAIRSARIPILLIHGDADRNIDIRHSRALHAANPVCTRLWEVPGAGHVAALPTAPADYISTVVAWFTAR